jgi:hypothetical protein
VELGVHWNLIENVCPLLALAGSVRFFVEGVASDEGKGEGGLGIDHLLVGDVYFAPTAGFLQGAAGESAVAGVSYGDLDCVLVHRRFDAEHVRGYDDVLREVFGNAAADHEQTSGGVSDLELGDLVEVLDGVDRNHGLALASVLVGDEAEASGAIGEGGAEDRHVLLVGSEDDGVACASLWSLAFFDEISPHLVDELAGAVGAGFERVGDLVDGLVADAQLVLVDEGVVDAIDGKLAELAVERAVLVLVAGEVVVEAEGLEEVLIDDVGAGGDDGVDHVVADEVDQDLLETCGDERAGEAEDDAAVGVVEHHVVDGGCAVGVTRGVGHVLHGIDQRNDVVLLDIEVLDGVGEEFFFRWHGSYQDSNFSALLMRD